MFKQKRKKEDWMLWKGIYEGWIRLIRVDVSFENINYKHTYCVELTYSDGKEDIVPSDEFMKVSAQIENKLVSELNKQYKNKVFFVGSDTFGGKRILVFVSDYEFHDLEWPQLVAQTIPDEDMDAVICLNDNMAYYNECLYPDFIREKLKEERAKED